jgi:hypothetical protein
MTSNTDTAVHGEHITVNRLRDDEGPLLSVLRRTGKYQVAPPSGAAANCRICPSLTAAPLHNTIGTRQWVDVTLNRTVESP